MNDQERANEICSQAIKHFGGAHQLVKLLEEMSELSSEIGREYTKCLRKKSFRGLFANPNIKEEFIDVFIVMSQFFPYLMDHEIYMEKINRREGIIAEDKKGE